MLNKPALLFTLSLGTALAASQAQLVPNGGFETPNAGPIGQYWSLLYNPTGGAWTFLGNSGVAANGSGFVFYRAGTPAGSQFAFLQGKTGVGGSISETLPTVATTGLGSLSFLVSQRDITGRDNTQPQTLSVLWDGLPLASYTPASTAWETYSLSSFPVTAGLHTLGFSVPAITGDATILLDQVQFSVTAAPEPSTTLLLLGGLASLGLRRRFHSQSEPPATAGRR